MFMPFAKTRLWLTPRVAGCVLAAALAIPSAIVPVPVRADTYPSRAITVIVPFAAGGPTDIVGRIIAEGLSRALGRPVVVENVGGAGGTTGSLRLARAAPDGYTIGIGQMGTHAFAVALYPSLAYDPIRDFSTIGLVASASQILVTKKRPEPLALRAFGEEVRNRGTSASNAHAGVGATSHVACLLFAAEFRASPTYVPYRGTAPALSDLVAGHVDYMCDQITNVINQVRAGTISPVALFAPRRSAVLPDVPTAAEQGHPNLNAVIWNALYAPAGIPADRLDTLRRALNIVLDHPDTRRRLEELGAEIPSGQERDADWFTSFVRGEITKWSNVIRAAGVTAGN